jgi:DNA-binding SARP family transcriptional activator
MPLLEAHVRLFQAHLNILEGKSETAWAALRTLLREVRQTGCDLFVAAALLGQSHIALDAGDRPAATESLREGLAIGARWGYGHLFLYAAPEAESRLCAYALETGIEPCYVRRLIETRGLRPPGHAGECWPWPVRIFSLGGFRLMRAGEVLRQAGKPQKRPLELLKALVAQGPAGATGLALAALLWPDSGDAGLKKTLEITLHRLRKLLGRDDAVLLLEGRLALNPCVCWVDLWAFEQSAERTTKSVRIAPIDAAAIEREAPHPLRLYAGAFLATDEDAAWMLPARDRATSRFQRLVADLGQYHEQAGCWETAAELYRRGLEQDNLNEFLYRRLIYCLQKQDQHAQALGVYRRCRELLSIVLGISPCQETQALIQASRETERTGIPTRQSVGDP